MKPQQIDLLQRLMMLGALTAFSGSVWATRADVTTPHPERESAAPGWSRNPPVSVEQGP